jgi:hypothetical protein|nr:MAG TPA: hypothetical protein [Caudoviricetes sp.]
MTVFRKGMKVYDQIFYPDEEGKVIKVYQDCIKVVFGYIEMSYSLDGRTTLYKEKPTLSTKPYKVQIEGFEQKSHAPEFDEALDWLDNNENYQTVFEDERTYPSKEIYEAFEALRKLIILRDYYNEGSMKANYSYFVDGSNILRFKTCEIRDRFKEEQEELLNKAKPLL